MLNEFSSLKLSDFGLSKKISDLVAAPLDSDPNKGKHGAPYYMAPELF